jgi:basic secretory peptidase family protein
MFTCLKVAIPLAIGATLLAADASPHRAPQPEKKKQESQQKYTVEFVVDVTDAPEMKDWAEKVARICERQYPMICEELKSDGFKPTQRIMMALKKDYKGVASTSGDNIVGSVQFFKAHPDDVGAFVHETVHVVQKYQGRGNPGWLVEGIADYIRFFKYEPGKIGRLDPERVRYDGSYRQSAAFLAYLTEKYDRELVRKINAVMREGKYKEEIFKELTGKTVQELGNEWKASLRSR